MQVVEWLRKAHRRGCPLLAVSTPEPLGMVKELRQHNLDQIVWRWDCAAGLVPLTEAALGHKASAGQSPDALLEWALQAPEGSIILAHWHNEYWQDALVRQGVLNLRDVFKGERKMLVLLGRSLVVHPAVRADFLLYEDALPASDALLACLAEVEQNAGCTPLEDAQRERAVDALRGMTVFQAEQHAAMAATQEGVLIEKLWQDKIALINSTPGLQVWRGGEQIADVAGLEGILSYLNLLRGGRQPIRLVVWVDESEDALAGTEGDTSGVSQDYLGRLAGHIQDTGAQCLLLNGHPGTGKSLTAKVAGSLFECLVLALDLGACKASLVGESESNLRHALAVERAIVGDMPGSTLWVWTTNNAEALPAKLRSRMQAEFFADLPSEQDQLAIWSLYRHKFEIDQQEPYPECEGWVGREIERCCRLAWQLRCTLQEASRYVVPSSISQISSIAERRKKASNRYLDASKGGVFQVEDKKRGRKIDTSA